MPRNVTASFRLAAESSFSDEVDLVFLTITHPTLSEPIRLNWDTKDFVYGGATFTGFPFDIELLTDDEGPPTARLQIQNIDPRIGDTIRMLTTPPQLKIELLSSADFDLTTDPRTEFAGLDPNTVLLLHCDGSDGSTIFTDSSASGHTITVNGNAQIDTAQSQFGGASALFDGTGDYLATPSHANFTFGTGDFDISFWIKFNAIGAPSSNMIGDASDTLTIYRATDNTIHFYSGGEKIVGTTAITTGASHHIALARSSGSTRLFLDGTQEGSTFVDATNYAVTSFRIGSSTGASNFVNGWMDEIRILKGSADHTTAFTPPIAAYVGGGPVTIIYSADRLFLTNVSVDVISISGQIVGWDYVQRVWPGKRATQPFFPGLFR